MDEGLEGEPIEGWRVLYKRKEGRRERWGRKELEKVKKYRKRKEKGMEERKGAGRRREEGEQGRKEQRKEGRKKVRLGGWIEIKWMDGCMERWRVETGKGQGLNEAPKSRTMVTPPILILWQGQSQA